MKRSAELVDADALLDIPIGPCSWAISVGVGRGILVIINGGHGAVKILAVDVCRTVPDLILLSASIASSSLLLGKNSLLREPQVEDGPDK